MTEQVAERPTVPTGTQLITLDPQTYVTGVYAPFRTRLAEAKAAVANIETVDVSTKEAMAVAIKHRATFRTLRTEAEKARVQRKAPILEIGRLLDSRYREIESEILQDEERFHDAIVAEQTRKEREREEREKAEAARIAAIQDALARLNNAAAAYVGKPSAEIAAGLEKIRAHDVAGWAAEFLPVAQEAHAKAVAALEQLLAGALAQEKAKAEEEARIKAEREELARLRAEQIERDRQEQARVVEENRKRAAAEAEARAKIEAAERESRARIEAEERAARLAREEEDRKARAVAEEQRKTREAEEAKAKAIRDAEEARQRAERERLAEESRALAEQQRQAQEREAAAQREIERAQIELMDGNAMLAKFVERFGKRKEFATIVRAINAYLQPGRKEAA